MLREGEKKNLHLFEVVETSVTGTVRAMEGCFVFLTATNNR